MQTLVTPKEQLPRIVTTIRTPGSDGSVVMSRTIRHSLLFYYFHWSYIAIVVQINGPRRQYSAFFVMHVYYTCHFIVHRILGCHCTSNFNDLTHRLRISHHDYIVGHPLQSVSRCQDLVKRIKCSHCRFFYKIRLGD